MAKKFKSTGEIGVAVTHNGKKETLEPISIIKLPLKIREVQSTIACGFRQEWISAEVNGSLCKMDAGAGVGSRWLTFEIFGKQYCADMGDLFSDLINKLRED